MLVDNVKSANKNFDSSMDNIFMLQGQWKKSNKKYIKDIVAGSTLIDHVLYERKAVRGYIDYNIGPISLETRLDDEYLEGLESFAIQALIYKVQDEVSVIASDIFGDGERIEVDKDRSYGTGKFGEYIGYGPSVRDIPKGTTNDKIFYDEGEGEQGRLLTEYIYWQSIESVGLAEISMAPWDKRIWDDRDSFFTSPSIRSMTDFVLQAGLAVFSVASTIAAGPLGAVGSMALMAAINSSDDLVFATLDTAFGYKDWTEAGFEFGKTLLINTANSFLSGAFGGVSGIESGFLKGGLNGAVAEAATGTLQRTVGLTMMAGAQAITTGTITSVISGITYNEKDGFGYNSSIFNQGMEGTLKNALTSMTSVAVKGTMDWIIGGKNMEKIGNYSSEKQKNIDTFNTLIGDLARQGVSYGMGDAFSLNLLNTSLLNLLGIKGSDGNNKIFGSTGLLELHLGRDGSSMNFGTGGANVSIDNVINAAKGAGVWGLEGIVGLYNLTHIDIRGAWQTINSFGYDKQKKLFWEVMFGKTDLKTALAGAGYEAKTVTDENGKKNIFLKYQEGMDYSEQMRLALTLGHEAHRDGIVTSDNYMETRTSVSAHTEMAIRMLSDGKHSFLDKNLMNDLHAYSESNGDMSKFYQYVDNNYDSSQDYWKLTKDGKLLYDGKFDLFDENGRLLKEATGKTFSKSLAEWMGISQTEAQKILRDGFGMTWNGKVWSKPAIDNFAATASLNIQATYEWQWKYIDQVNTKYGGSMVAAISDFSNGNASMWHFIDGGMYGWSTDLGIFSDKYKEMHNQYNNYMKYAVAYDEYMSTAFSSDLNRQYSSQEAQNAFSEVIRDLWDKNFTDTNSMYVHYSPDGLLFNVGFDDAMISTKSHYKNKDGTQGAYHSSGVNGLSIDIAKTNDDNPITGSSVYTSQYERIDHIGWSGDYGVRVRTQTLSSVNIYAHLLDELTTPNSYLNQLQNLKNLSEQAGMFSLTLPPGTAIGRVGSTGNSRGPHLHYEMRVK
jgi:hypothetical protein